VWSKSGDSWKKVVWDKNAGNFGGYILEAKFSEAPDFIAAQQHAIDGLDDLHTLFVNQKELEFLNRIVT
jgi:hypothetical protein